MHNSHFMRNSENIQALNKTLDFIRLGSIVLLLMHFYAVCYSAMLQWKLTIPFIDRIIFNLSQNISFLSGVNNPKLAALFLLTVSLVGGKGKKMNT